MALSVSGDASCQPEKLNETKHDPCLLLSLPLELREKIYVYNFESIHARRMTAICSYFHNELAILATCKKLRNEASSILFNQTPLRFIVGHRPAVSSTTPPQAIIDRFQNVDFRILTMNTTHPSYDFRGVFEPLIQALFISPAPLSSSVLRRNSCYIHCELSGYAGGYTGREFLARLKSFTAFETFTIDFEGREKRSDFFPQPLIADDDPRKESKLSTLRIREGSRQREVASLSDLEKMFAALEGYLGKGEMLEVSEGREMLYAKRLVFHPLQHKDISHEDT